MKIKIKNKNKEMNLDEGGTLVPSSEQNIFVFLRATRVRGSNRRCQIPPPPMYAQHYGTPCLAHHLLVFYQRQYTVGIIMLSINNPSARRGS